MFNNKLYYYLATSAESNAEVVLKYAETCAQNNLDETLDTVFRFVMTHVHNKNTAAKQFKLVYDLFSTKTDLKNFTKSLLTLIDLIVFSPKGLSVPALENEVGDSSLKKFGQVVYSSTWNDSDSDELLSVLDAEFTVEDELKSEFGILYMTLSNDDQRSRLVKAFSIMTEAEDFAINDGTPIDELLEVVSATELIEPNLSGIEFKTIFSHVIIYDSNMGELINPEYISRAQGVTGSKFEAHVKYSAHQFTPETTQKIESISPTVISKPPSQSGYGFTKSLISKGKSDSSKSSPIHLVGEARDLYLNTLTESKEKSFWWALIKEEYPNKEEREAKYPNGFASKEFAKEYKEKRAQRLAKYNIEKKEEVKVEEKSLDKKIKLLGVVEPKPEDEIVDTVSFLYGSSSASSFFKTKSGYIAYVVKIQNSITNYCQMIDEIKTACEIKTSNVRCYHSNKLPIAVSNTEQEPVKLGEIKAGKIKKKNLKLDFEEKACFICVTDVKSEHVIPLDSDEFRQQQIEFDENKTGTILLDLHQLIMFRWMTCCNEDFRTIFYDSNLGIIRGICETRNTSTNSSRKSAFNNIGHMRVDYSRVLNDAEFVEISNDRFDTCKRLALNIIKNYTSVGWDTVHNRRIKGDTKHPNLGDVHIKYYKFIQRRIEEADVILEHQKW